ncbi:MAG: hypothetical protein R6X19_11050 [Kiritimatiellia bacterium]
MTHPVTARRWKGERLYYDKADRLHFLDLLGAMVERYRKFCRLSGLDPYELKAEGIQTQWFYCGLEPPKQ